MEINICRDFSDTPGARFKTEGAFSGEEFRDSILEPTFLEAQSKKEKLLINLDGSYGYPTSFLEEAFGGLSRKYGAEAVLNVLSFVSDDEPSLIEEIVGYIRDAKKEGK